MTLRLIVFSLFLVTTPHALAVDPSDQYRCHVTLEGKPDQEGVISLRHQYFDVPLEETGETLRFEFVWDGTYNILIISGEDGNPVYQASMIDETPSMRFVDRHLRLRTEKIAAGSEEE